MRRLLFAPLALATTLLGASVIAGAALGATPIGAETIYTEDNWNITRGLVWALQPISHTGLAVGGESGNFYYQAAAANSSTDANSEANSSKSGLFTVGWANDNMGLHATYMFTDDLVSAGTTAEGDSSHFVDLVGTWDPSDNLAVWMNFDYINTTAPSVPLSALDGDTYGIALASRLAVSDATGVAIRGEWVGVDLLGTLVNSYSVTGTADHALTDKLFGGVSRRRHTHTLEGDEGEYLGQAIVDVFALLKLLDDWRPLGFKVRENVFQGVMVHPALR